MRLILLGPPGAGKGTQASLITKFCDTARTAPSDALRGALQTQTRLGMEAKKVMDAGAVVRDDIIIGLVKDRLQQVDCQNGYLCDRFPRWHSQADASTETNNPP